MKPPSRSKPQPPPSAPTRSSHFFSKAKAMHSTTPILPSCNYYCNPTHKISECNIPSEDLFCDYCGKKGHHEAVCFAKFPERKQLQLPRQNLPTLYAPFNQKLRQLGLPHKLSSLRVIPIKMFKKKSIMLTRGRCFKPMPLKFKLCNMNSNH